MEAVPVVLQQSQSSERVSRTREGEPLFPQWLLNTGFLVSLALAVACLSIAGSYLFRYLDTTQSSIDRLLGQAMKEPATIPSLEFALNASMVTSRITLLSCGIMVGLCTLFLGFGLFLLGIKGELDVEAAKDEAWRVKIARLSPGLFVILCGTALVAACVLKTTPFSYQKTAGPVRDQSPITFTTTESGAGSLLGDHKMPDFESPAPSGDGR